MSSDDTTRSLSRAESHRRRFLQGIGATGAAGLLAGCLGGDGENGDDNDDDEENGGSTDPEPAYFAVSGLDPEETSVTRGDVVEVSATVENTGGEEGAQNVALEIDGEEFGSEELTLGAESSEDVSFEVDSVDLDAGEYTHAITSEDEEASGSLTVESILDDPDALFSFDSDPVRLVTGETAISGTVENTYDVAVEGGEVSLSLPDGWEVQSQEGASFDLDSGDSQPVSWQVSIPEDGSGEYELSGSVTYSALGEDADVSISSDATVVARLSPPWGLNSGNQDGNYDSVEIDGLALDDEIPEAVTVLGDGLSTSVREDPPEVEGSESDELYYTEHFGTDLGYDIPLPNGVYELTLHFAETWFGENGSNTDGLEGEGSRIFDVSINGDTVLEEFDIYAEAGGAYIAITRSYIVEVTDGFLTIETSTAEDNTLFNGVEVRPSDADPDLAGHYDASQLDLEDGDAVAAWPDANGGGPDLTQDDEGAQPTYQAEGANGNPTVRFEGDSDFINADRVATDDTAGVTMVAAFSTHDPMVARQTVLFNGSDGDGTGYGIYVNNEEGADPGSEGYLHALYGGVNWWWSDTTAVEEQFHVVTLTIPEDAPDEPVLRLDGQELETELQLDANPPQAPTTQFGIGYDDGDVEARPPYFHGDIGEAMIYDRELSGEERASLETALAQKWGGEVADGTYVVPQTGGGVAEESAFTLLPEEGTIEDAEPDDYDAEQLSAEFSFGYDEENLYLLGEVSDDAHHAIAGEGMWEADSIQYAAGYDGTYGPEDGLSHADGETSTHRWMDGENAAGLDQVDATTSRDDEAGVTTYEATIPWEAILPEAPEPGDAFRFGVIVNNDDDGEGREAVLNWTSPAINVDKEYGALGTFVLEE